jgi:hypothetical protein
MFSREFERIMIIAAATWSLWMGWQLFLRLPSDIVQSGKLTFSGLVIQLQRVGPGVFFAAFGAVVLGVSMWNLPTFELVPSDGSAKEQVKVRLAEPLPDYDARSLDRQIIALSIALKASEDISKNNFGDSDRILLSAAPTATSLKLARKNLLEQRFDASRVQTWIKNPKDSSVRDIDEAASKIDYNQ